MKGGDEVEEIHVMFCTYCQPNTRIQHKQKFINKYKNMMWFLKKVHCFFIISILYSIPNDYWLPLSNTKIAFSFFAFFFWQDFCPIIHKPIFLWEKKELYSKFLKKRGGTWYCAAFAKNPITITFRILMWSVDTPTSSEKSPKNLLRYLDNWTRTSQTLIMDYFTSFFKYKDQRSNKQIEFFFSFLFKSFYVHILSHLFNYTK